MQRRYNFSEFLGSPPPPFKRRNFLYNLNCKRRNHTESIGTMKTSSTIFSLKESLLYFHKFARFLRLLRVTFVSLVLDRFLSYIERLLCNTASPLTDHFDLILKFKKCRNFGPTLYYPINPSTVKIVFSGRRNYMNLNVLYN